VEWKKDTSFNGINKEGGCQDNAGSNSRNSKGLVQGVWTKRKLKEHSDSFGNEVVDENDPDDDLGSPKQEMLEAFN